MGKLCTRPLNSMVSSTALKFQLGLFQEVQGQADKKTGTRVFGDVAARDQALPRNKSLSHPVRQLSSSLTGLRWTLY